MLRIKSSCKINSLCSFGKIFFCFIILGFSSCTLLFPKYFDRKPANFLIENLWFASKLDINPNVKYLINTTQQSHFAKIEDSYNQQLIDFFKGELSQEIYNKSNLVKGNTYHLEEKYYIHLIKVMRLNIGEQINLFNEKNNGETVLKLIDAGHIKSAHDVSIGGIITAVSKMCIKGNKGINLKKPKYLINEIEYYFGEDQGRYIIEVSKDSLKKVTDILNKNAVHYDELGTINEDQLFINEKTKVSIDELTTSNTNWLTNYMSK